MAYCVHWFIRGPAGLAMTIDNWITLPKGARKRFGVWVRDYGDEGWVKVHRAEEPCPKGWVGVLVAEHEPRDGGKSQ